MESSRLWAGISKAARSGVTRGLSQTRALGSIGVTYGALLLLPWISRALRETEEPWSVLLPLIAALLLLASEIFVVLWANVLLECIPGLKRYPQWLDRLKAVFLSVFLVLSLALGWSALRIGIQLSLADALRYAKNSVQMAEEATDLERRILYFVPVFLIVTLIAIAWALERDRRRLRGPSPRWVGVLSVLLWGGFAALHLQTEGLVFRDTPFPEARALVKSQVELESLANSTRKLPREALFGPRIVPLEPPEKSQRPQIVFVLLEAVAAHHVGAFGGRADATPNLDALASACIAFPRAYATSSHSDYAQMAILSGLYPKKSMKHDFYVDIPYPRTLIWDILKPSGYTTAIFSCQNETWGNMTYFFRTPGLDELWHSYSWPEATHRGESKETKVFEETPLKEWKRWRREHRGRETFTYLNFQATHFTYEHPQDFPSRYNPSEIDFPASWLEYPKDKIPVMENRFYNALHYADFAVGEVVKDLKATGDWENTLLLVVPDHGEAFYEHGFPTHATGVHEEQVRSFALVCLPGEPGRVVNEPISHLDLVPSILRQLELPRSGAFQGNDTILTPEYSASGRALFFSVQGLTQVDGILLDDWKYIVNWHDGTDHLYHLTNDPQEQNDLTSQDLPEEDRLRSRLVRFLERQFAYYREEVWLDGYYPPRAE